MGKQLRKLAWAGGLALILAGCSSLGSTTTRTACRVQVLLRDATSTLERGKEAHEAGDAGAAAAAGKDATRTAAGLHDLLPFAIGLDAGVKTDLEGAATLAKRLGAELSGDVTDDARLTRDLGSGVKDIEGVATRWASTLQSAAVTCAEHPSDAPAAAS